MSERMEFTDRYQALGIAYPDPETMCKGDCEGIGVYPQFYALGPPEEGECRPVEESTITTTDTREALRNVEKFQRPVRKADKTRTKPSGRD